MTILEMSDESTRPHSEVSTQSDSEVSIELESTSFTEDTWIERIKRLPEPGTIRLLTPPSDANYMVGRLWFTDKSLTDWNIDMEEIREKIENNPVFAALCPPNLLEQMERIFFVNQRARWLASVVLRKWKTRVWAKRTQCNVDMIDLEPIPDRDAIFMTDTAQRQTFRFHRNDVFRNLIANICLSEEMLPYPRPPTNQWTNKILTLGQTISICEQLAKRGMGSRSHIFLAAFCAARYDTKRFATENTPMLAQHAIESYFKDLTTDNAATVYDAIANVLTELRLRYTPTVLLKWLKETPQTDLHREWLKFVRDYTLYTNLHVQIRPHWVNMASIYRDVRDLYSRTVSGAFYRTGPVSNVIPNSIATVSEATVHGFIDMHIIPTDFDLSSLLIAAAMLR